MSRHTHNPKPGHSPLVIRDIHHTFAVENYNVAEHVHNVYQWYCVLDGVVAMTIDGETLILQPGQSVIVAPGSRRSPKAESKKSPEYMFIFFEDIGLGLSTFTNRILTADGETWQNIRKLKDESRNPRDGMARFYCENLIGNILVQLVRNCDLEEDGNRHPSVRHHELIQRLDMFMRTKLDKPISRKMLAEFVHISPPHLARIFMVQTGMTPLDYLTKIRIERAKTLLADSSLSVTNIAMEVGYESISHFSQLFRKVVGITPLKYRFMQEEKHNRKIPDRKQSPSDKEHHS